MDYRHEYKHEISQANLVILRQRLRAITNHDPHTVSGEYLIRSLYFDNAEDKALREKLDGVSRREKFRIRYYNYDTSFIRLGKKTKVGSLGKKQSAVLTAVQVQNLLNGCLDWMPVSGDATIILEVKWDSFLPDIIRDAVRLPGRRSAAFSKYAQCRIYG